MGPWFFTAEDGCRGHWRIYLENGRPEPLQRERDPRIESNWHNDGGDEDGINNTTHGSDSEEDELVVQQVAIGCVDGVARIYVVHEEGMEYYRLFPRVKGKNLSVVWSLDAKNFFAIDSDGCIRCWVLTKPHKLYMIKLLLEV